MRAYRKARTWLRATPAAKVAEAEASFFPEIDRAVLTSTIAAYQKLGCWTPHVEITRPAFEATLDIFEHAKLITKRHRYEDRVAPPPGAAAGCGFAGEAPEGGASPGPSPPPRGACRARLRCAICSCARTAATPSTRRPSHASPKRRSGTWSPASSTRASTSATTAS